MKLYPIYRKLLIHKKKFNKIINFWKVLNGTYACMFGSMEMVGVLCTLDFRILKNPRLSLWHMHFNKVFVSGAGVMAQRLWTLYALSNHKYVILASGPNALILPCTHAHTHACATHTHTCTLSWKKKGWMKDRWKKIWWVSRSGRITEPRVLWAKLREKVRYCL